MTTYTLPPDGLKPFRRTMAVRVLKIYGPLFIVLALVSGLLGVLANPLQATIVLGLALLLFGYTGYRAVRLQLGRLASLRLSLDGDGLTRQLAGLPDLAIRRKEITGLEETSAGLYVRTADRERFVFAPRGLEGYDDLRTRLAAWQPSDLPPVSPETAPRKTGLTHTATMTLLAVCVLAMVIVFNSQDVRLVVPAGIVLAGLLIWSVPTIRRSPSYSPALKRSVWLVVFPLLAIVAKVVLVVQAALGR